MAPTELTVRSILATRVSIELNEPFGIATGAQERADNVLVQLQLSDGSSGIGEAAPFPDVNGETQASALAALEQAIPTLVGLSARQWRRRAREAAEMMRSAPSAVCAFESALLDAWCRSHRLSMWSLFGGVERELTTDITVTTGSVAHASDSAKRAEQAGFSILKVKVGADSLDADIERLRAIGTAAPRAALVIDANCAFTPERALELLKEIGPLKRRVTLFEQPTAADDLDGLRQVMLDGRIAVAADESARQPRDVVRLAKSGAVSAINVKITKSGIVDALDMIALARRHDLDLMIGGMVESRLCMSVSACLAAGQGGFGWVDLDTPLFLKDSPFVGGYRQEGARLDPTCIESGHGVSFEDTAPPSGYPSSPIAS